MLFVFTFSTDLPLVLIWNEEGMRKAKVVLKESEKCKIRKQLFFFVIAVKVISMSK